MLIMYLYCFALSIKQKSLKKYLSSKHSNINFSLEKQNNRRLLLAYAFFKRKGLRVNKNKNEQMLRKSFFVRYDIQKKERERG